MFLYFRLDSPPVRPSRRLRFLGMALLLIETSCFAGAAAAQETSSANAAAVPLSPERLRAFERHALTHPGDAQRGRELYLDQKVTKCGVCHKVDGQGGEAGPDLTAIGGKFDRPHLIESMLEPSRQIVEGFRTTAVVLKDGRVKTGIVRAQSAERISLAEANGQLLAISVADVDQRSESNVSLMPQNLQDALTPEQFADLVAYLETLRPGGKVTPGAATVGPIQLPKGFELRTIATGLTGCTALETIADGRVLVCEQTGALRVIKDGKLLEKPFVTLPVESYWERGLIGVTVDPHFPQAPYVYVCYVAKEPHPHHRVSRFTADGDVAVPGSEKILLTGDDQRTLGGKVPAGHQGGALHFGLDGTLFVAIGENTAETPSQDLRSLQGKILRINSDGSIPRDNLFFDRTEGKYRSIWAMGCRNPFTFAVRRPSGELFINDVGGKFEEINIGVPGGNYGWPAVEHGPTDDRRFVGPIHIYPQASISGGDFAPADLPWPQHYRGRYFFADFVHGWIKTLDPERHEHVADFATSVRRATDLRFALDGSLYVLVRNAWVIDDKFQPATGSLLQIRFVGEKAAAAAETVKLTEDAVDESAGGLAAYKIVTPRATYFLEKTGAGLSSMIDKDGNDWLGFRPEPGSGAAGEYRGFPNAVHQQAGSYFHPKNAGTDPSTTKVESATEERVTITAESSNGLWACRYDFHPTHCTFTMTRMPSDKRYWALYEGVPGGGYNDDDWWITSAVKQPQPLTKRHDGDIPAPEWIAFGDKRLKRALYLLHHEDDEHPDTFYQMQQKMTVFGFGRRGVEKFHSAVPQRFTLGFVESADHDSINREIQALPRRASGERRD